MKWLFVFLLLASQAMAEDPQGEIVVTVRDFSKGMTPGITPMANDPEMIVKSDNMYVTQAGTRQLRFGFRSATTSPPIDSGVTALSHFIPSNDSAAWILTSGGKWWAQKTGKYKYGQRVPGGEYNVTNDTTVEIRPLFVYDSMYNAGDTLRGFGTRFVRDLMPGDTIDLPGSIANEAIEEVMSDTKIRMTSAWSKDSTIRSGAKVMRVYPTGKGRPFLRQFGNRVYTGSVNIEPQKIVPTDTSFYITRLGLIDSLTIDNVHTRWTDSVYGLSWSYGGAGADTQSNWVEFVDRGRGFEPDAYSSGVEGNATNYYLRLGTNRAITDTSWWGRTFQIVYNTDSSIVVRMNMYDISSRSTYTKDRGPLLADSLTTSGVAGTRAYIYSATGLLREVFSEAQCGTARVLGAGATLSTTSHLMDTAGQDHLNYGMYFVQILQDTVTATVRQYYAGQFTTRREKFLKVGGTPPAVDTSIGETVLSKKDTIICSPDNRGGCVNHVWSIWTIKTPKSVLAGGKSLYNTFLPILYAYWTDSLHIITSAGENARPASDVVIQHWRIVKADLPMWSGMTDFDNRLIGWGDSLSGAMINLSGRLEPDKWNPVGILGEPNDIFLEHPEDPVYHIEPFDNQAVIFRKKTMLGWNGETFTQLSLSDGIVGARAAITVGNYLYFVSRNGLNIMERRDLSGYSIHSISDAVAPIFNAWNSTAFGVNVAPYTINQAYMHEVALGYNKRDDHLYILFPNGSSTSNTNVMTYSLRDKIFDGTFNIKGSVSVWADQADTSRVFFGRTTRAGIYALDYTYNDTGNGGINGDLKSAEFYLTDADGSPAKAKLAYVVFIGRALNGTMDSAFIDISSRDDSHVSEDDATQTTRMNITSGWPIAYTAQSTKFTAWPDSNNVASIWQWEIKTYGKASASIFQPYLLQFHFIPMWRYN